MHEITVTRDVPCTGTADGPRQHLDVYAPSADGPVPVVLLWHGLGPDEKDVMGALAERIAREGLLVLVPDWRSDAPDSGRSHLLASLAHAREHAAALGGDPERLVLAGWSAGAGAAVGVALRPDVVAGWRPTAVVAVAGRYDVPARTAGRAAGHRPRGRHHVRVRPRPREMPPFPLPRRHARGAPRGGPLREYFPEFGSAGVTTIERG
ncbi:alpha/beta hydrolase family protein [Streptomyces sp. NPDC016845]|uniref:alpha/beta hydrolase family protein n=1 Tax=Streptomyces sp. NPDC016845 TaxID=3364972 RepID=UPI0037BCA1CA